MAISIRVKTVDGEQHVVVTTTPSYRPDSGAVKQEFTTIKSENDGVSLSTSDAFLELIESCLQHRLDKKPPTHEHESWHDDGNDGEND